MRLYLDANILFSAAWRPDSAAEALFLLAAAGWCTLTTSRLALEEARHNIRNKQPVRAAALERLMAGVKIGAEPSSSALQSAAAYGLPDKDVPILAAAMTQQADALVTGDRRDIGHLYGQTVKSVRILSLADAITAVIDR